MIPTNLRKFAFAIGCFGATLKLALILMYRFSGNGSVLQIILSDYLPAKLADVMGTMMFGDRKALPSLGDTYAYDALLVLGSLLEWAVGGLAILMIWNALTAKARPHAS